MAVLASSGPVLSQTAEIVGRPRVTEDRVAVRVKVTEDGEQPAMLLQEEDFQAIVDGEPVELRGWKSPEESTPPPAWIVVLIDFSGSMNQEDSSGTTKLQGAIKATRRFLEEASDRGGDTKVAILPFGEAGKNCPESAVTEQKIAQKFFPVDDAKQQNLLDYLSSQEPCASTNIYDPLKETIRLFGDEENPDFYLPEESQLPEPRLSVILLSDGYHNKSNEQQDFENLISRLERHDNIVVHTLGYGLTPEKLGEKYGLGRPAERKDIQTANKPNNPVPAEEFVDANRLRQIAEVTGGISEFSGNADDIAEALQLFLNALLGEYELIYDDPNPERGSKHEVFVLANLDRNTLATTAKSYTITVFGRCLPLGTRVLMTLSILLVLGVFGVLPFWWWSD